MLWLKGSNAGLDELAAVSVQANGHNTELSLDNILGKSRHKL